MYFTHEAFELGLLVNNTDPPLESSFNPYPWPGMDYLLPAMHPPCH
jgi:hypothetical protein